MLVLELGQGFDRPLTFAAVDDLVVVAADDHEVRLVSTSLIGHGRLEARPVGHRSPAMRYLTDECSVGLHERLLTALCGAAIAGERIQVADDLQGQG